MTHDPTEARAALSRLRALTRAVADARAAEAAALAGLKAARKATAEAIKARDRAIEGELAGLPLLDGRADG